MPAHNTETRVADMSASRLPTGRAAAALSLALLLVACASPKHQAPVEERPMGTSGRSAGTSSGTSTTSPTAGTTESKPLPGAENAGKPGYYTVKPGDTLIRVALDNGQTWRDLVRWNSLPNPNLIEVGQVLRVVPPGADAGVSTKPVGVARVETRPLDGKQVPTTSSASAASSASTGASSAPASSAVAAGSTAASSTKGEEDDIAWAWPVSGGVVQGYDETRNKGLDFGGKQGEPVFASANGRVVYVGSGIRGYGNIIILKHGTDYLSVYAHNQAMLVKEEQVVLKGQKIAEMGSSDADQVKLHFEVRKGGKTLDPAKVLPPR